MPAQTAHTGARRAWLGAIVAVLLLAARDPDGAVGRVQGRWVNAGSSVELNADGGVVLRTPRGAVRGRYTQRPGSQVRVQLGGEPRYLYATERRGVLSLCQLQNYRHCMQFHRPGRPVELISR